MKFLVAAVLAYLPFAVFAEACPHTEYAELKDMSKDELQTKYCELKQYQDSKKRDADAAAHSGQMVAFQLLQYSFQCESEAKRVSEVMKRSYASDPAACEAPDAAPVAQP